MQLSIWIINLRNTCATCSMRPTLEWCHTEKCIETAKHIEPLVWIAARIISDLAPVEGGGSGRGGTCYPWKIFPPSMWPPTKIFSSWKNIDLIQSEYEFRWKVEKYCTLLHLSYRRLSKSCQRGHGHPLKPPHPGQRSLSASVPPQKWSVPTLYHPCAPLVQKGWWRHCEHRSSPCNLQRAKRAQHDREG